MNVRRPPPGAELSTGRIRVDAAKAIAKLREYRLADPTAWILEAIRAAVGSGATRIALDGDADDVWLRWDGPVWPADDLPQLFDELVSPEPAADLYHRRVLAAALNSALGLHPSWIDVIAVAGGTAARVRFSPATITPGDDGAAPLRDLAAEPTDRPSGVGDPGMAVHLHRRLGLGTIGRFLTGEEALELALARWACRDIAVPMTIAGKAVGRDHHHDDLLRVPLDQDLGGFLALMDASLVRERDRMPVNDVAELGVRVVREQWTPLSLAESVSADRWPLPLRLVIDGPRMPTNASRSQVRPDGHPVAAARRRGDALVPVLIERLAEQLRRPTDDDARTAAFIGNGDSDGELAAHRATALALLAASVAGIDWDGDAIALQGSLKLLAALPLVRNAVGGWRSLVDMWHGAVFRGDEALPIRLAPWLGQMPWIPPGDAADVLLGGSKPDERTALRAIRAARRQLSARRAFMARPEHPARASLHPEARLRAHLGAGPAGCVPDDAFTGLTGEIVIVAAEGPGRMTLLLDSRIIASAVLEAPLAIDAVIAGAPITPDDRYRGVAVDAGYEKAERAARLAAIRAIEALVAGGAQAGVEVSAPRHAHGDDELVRVALHMAHAEGLGVPDESPLARAEIWPTPDGIRLGLAALRFERVIGVAAPANSVVPPEGRVLVLASPAEQKLLSKLLEPGIAVVPYSGAAAVVPIDPGLIAARSLSARTRAAALVVREGHLQGAIGFDSDGSTLAISHRGKRLSLVARARTHLGCAIIVDSEAVVPAEDWSSVRDDGGIAAADLSRWERALMVATTQALLGDPVPDLIIPQRPLRLEDPSGHALCRALLENTPEVVLGKDLVARLRAYPLVRRLGVPLPCSIDELCGAFADDIPAIDRADADAAFELDGWQPLVGGGEARAFVGALSRRRIVDGASEITERRKKAERRRRLTAHRARPTEALELPPSCAPIPLTGDVRGVCGVGEVDRLEAVVLVEGRRFARVVSSPDLPLRAVVEVAVDAVDLERNELGSLTNGRILAAVRSAAGRVLVGIATECPTMMVDDDGARGLLAAWLPDGHHKTRDALRSAPAWPSIQGPRVSLLAAARGPSVPTATWTGEWLSGDPADPLDGPVIAMPDGEAGDARRALIDAIGPWPSDDVTAEVRRLQAQRRVARGMVPAATVPGAAPALTRKLSQLDVNHGLGTGEITLDDAAISTLMLHVDGELRSSFTVDVLPAVRVAIEAPELVDALEEPGGISGARREQLTRQVQNLATSLIGVVAPSIARDTVPTWLRRRLGSTLLADRVDTSLIGWLPTFVTVTGDWVSWNDVASQDAAMGDVWYVNHDAAGLPLDPRRLVLRLDDGDVLRASQLEAVTFLDGSRELAADATARLNQQKQPLTRLELPAAIRGASLAVVELTTRAARRRGVVAILRPSLAAARGVHASRNMVPFERVDDPCAWPTVAVVEDPDLQGNRTWRQPAGDPVWHSLVDDIRTSSEAAWRGLVKPPASARETHVVTRWRTDGSLSPWDSHQVRGLLWIDGRSTGTITVSGVDGDTELDAPTDAPVSGHIYLARELGGLVEAVASLCKSVHGLLRPKPSPSPNPNPNPNPIPTPATRISDPDPDPETRPPTPTPTPTPTPEAPPHPMLSLALAVGERLDIAAPVTGGHRVTIARSRRDPALTATDNRVVLAGESPLLTSIVAAQTERALWTDSAIDALAAHGVTLLNRARELVDDRDERAALTRLLGA